MSFELIRDALLWCDRWPLPGGQTLADGEFVMLHMDGNMPPAGGRLLLFATSVSTSTPIDTMTIAALSAGQSQVRLGLYGSRWDATAAPTPGAANKVVSVTTPPVSTRRLIINEIMADNDSFFQDPDETGAFEDWFEVYNPTSEPIDMNGMYITDNPNNPTKWKVGDGVEIPAGGYLVFLADSEAAQGPNHASWSLSADGESISIYDTDGVTLLDSVSFPAQRTDVSYGRTADGSTVTFLATPTPGQPNSGPLQ